jgi:hypothetical protein
MDKAEYIERLETRIAELNSARMSEIVKFALISEIKKEIKFLLGEKPYYVGLTQEIKAEKLNKVHTVLNISSNHRDIKM